LKGFIVNPADLPRKGIKRLATSGKGKSPLMGKDVQPLQSVKSGILMGKYGQPGKLIE